MFNLCQSTLLHLQAAILLLSLSLLFSHSLGIGYVRFKNICGYYTEIMILKSNSEGE
jgi:hypothetical protein